MYWMNRLPRCPWSPDFLDWRRETLSVIHHPVEFGTGIVVFFPDPQILGNERLIWKEVFEALASFESIYK